MSVDMTQYQDALQLLSKEAKCAQLDMTERSEFARVWVYSAIYSIALVLLLAVPFYWCRTRKRKKFAEVRPATEDTEEAMQVVKNRGRQSLQDAQIKEIDFEAARRHLVRTSATEDDKWKNPITTSISEISKTGGSGTELYFRSLRNLGFIFAYKSALTLPTWAFCLLGNFAPDTGQFLLRGTISNLGRFVPTSLLDPTRRLISIGCEGALLEDITPFFAWLDFAGTLLFLVYVVWMRFVRIPNAAATDNREQVSVADFAVAIDCLPETIEDHRKYAELLEAHIVRRIKAVRACQKKPCDKDVSVRELTLVRDYKGRLDSLIARAQLAQNIEIQQAHGKEKKVEKLSEKLGRLDEKLSVSVAPEEDLPVLRAFAILNAPSDVVGLLHDYRFADYRLFRACQFNARRFEGSSIRVRRAPEPTDLIWENQDCPWCSKMLRRALVVIVFLLILVISLLAIYFITAFSKTMSEVQLSYIGHPACDPVIPQGDRKDDYKCEVAVAANWTQENATASGGDVLNCWCTAQGYEKLMEETSLQKACSPWFLSLATSIGVNSAASVIVLLINVVVQTVFIYLAQLEKHNSATGLNSSLMTKVAWAQTINTGFVLLAVNIYGPQALRDFASVIPGLGTLLFRGPFDDITRGWYAVVGVTIMTNMLLNAVVPASVTLGKMLVPVLLRRCFASGAKHQAELISYYTNPEFDIKGKYAQMLTTVFVTLTYSAGLPMLNGFAFFYFLFMYWADKFCLFWGSKRPPYYDTTMAKEASEAMLYAVGIHCFFAIWMLSQQCVFPSKLLGGALGELALRGASYSPEDAQTMSMRLVQETTWMFTIFLALLIAAWVLWWVLWLLGSTLGSVQDIISDTCCAKAEKLDEDVDEEASDSKGEVERDKAYKMEWDQAFVLIEKNLPPASFRMERHPDMIGFAHLLRGQVERSDSGVPVPQEGDEGFEKAVES
eukprot:TRINITY_DN5750_c0_g1_i1.p1 TRINITY_DN5750_c0_g1~~TRINITY_DN5750_c0_g1_i1.p1  ORF type:complete len:950 (+),score=173.43 TRINITY_DN5750_c0_g1_i1:52-2901(+)